MFDRKILELNSEKWSLYATNPKHISGKIQVTRLVCLRLGVNSPHWTKWDKSPSLFNPLEAESGQNVI
jgi:hypothetical protein